ncbi:DUF697 domain-containing protein [[Phormidium] sp. ETS-05]|uniref:DUF697 domain-containing protein n=1 Tax=[Phormidium] sp. ETS-05 TaxID=222819 RepID=UPI0018EF1D05|nr:DUF697 domain-containing protein [[Phormidium] sp. ETS-05]
MTSKAHFNPDGTESDRVAAALAEKISNYLQSSIQHPGISVSAAIDRQVLEVTLSAGNTAVSPNTLITSVRDLCKNLQLNFIKTLRIYWQEKGGKAPAQVAEFPLSEAQGNAALSTPETQATGNNPWQMLAMLSASVAAATSHAGKAVTDTALTIGGNLTAATSHAGKAVTDTALTIGGNLTAATSNAGKAVTDTALAIGDNLTVATSHAGKAVTDTAMVIGGTLGVAADNAGDFLGKVTDFAVNIPFVSDAIAKVNLVNAETALKKLQEQYPTETPQEIAHRLMVEKSMYSGGIGLATSILPGVALATLALDMAAVATLQAEMVYQIAGAYGLDLKAPERQREVLAIFGVGMGGSRAIKVGSRLLRTAPLVGAAIGASANAAMTYALGHAACRFYEAQDGQMWGQKNLAAAQEESEKYLAGVLNQEAIAAEILVRLILAAHPHKSREEVAAELASLNFTAASVAAISAHTDSPPPLDTLMQQLDEDFALPVLVNCLKIAQIHGTTPETTLVVASLVRKFNVDLSALPHYS